MKIIPICPACGALGVDVKRKTVKSVLQKPFWKKMPKGKVWAACSNPGCKVGYFSGAVTFNLETLKVPLWFKDPGANVPICYCSKLTRGEIAAAVFDGCKTIGAVQKKTKKNITGKCRRKNPLGKCYREVFLKAMEAVQAK
jgi:hypothetical protein